MRETDEDSAFTTFLTSSASRSSKPSIASPLFFYFPRSKQAEHCFHLRGNNRALRPANQSKCRTNQNHFCGLTSFDRSNFLLDDTLWKWNMEQYECDLFDSYQEMTQNSNFFIYLVLLETQIVIHLFASRVQPSSDKQRGNVTVMVLVRLCPRIRGGSNAGCCEATPWWDKLNTLTYCLHQGVGSEHWFEWFL